MPSALARGLAYNLGERCASRCLRNKHRGPRNGDEFRRVLPASREIFLDALIISAVTVWAAHRIGIPSCFFVFRLKNHFRKPLLMQVSKLKCHVAELYRSVCAHP